MTVQEAIKKHIAECKRRISRIELFMQKNKDCDIEKCKENIYVLEMAIQALEKQTSVEKVLERLGKLRKYEEYDDCPKDGMCDGGHCDTCYTDTAVQIIKEELT